MGKKINPDLGPADKLLSMYTLLLVNSREISLTELSLLLEISKPTASRLIRKLEASHFGKIIQIKQGRESFYCIDKPKNAVKLTLNAEGLNQLALCRDFMAHLLPASMRKTLNTTLEQASAYSTESESITSLPLANTAKSMTKGRIDYSPFQEQLQSLMDCIRKELVCTISYKSSLFKETKTYDFAPKRLVTYHDSISVQGFIVSDKGKPIPLYDDPNSLALQRIQEVIPTRHSSSHIPPIEVEGEDFFGLMGDAYGEEIFKVKIKFFGASANYVAERIWSDDQEIIVHRKKEVENNKISQDKEITENSQEQESISLTMSVRNVTEILSWVLSFGENAQIISPKWLIEEMQEKLETTRLRYKKA